MSVHKVLYNQDIRVCVCVCVRARAVTTVFWAVWCVIGYVPQFGELADKTVYDDDAILPFLMSSRDLSLVCMPTGTVGCLLFTFATDQRFAWLHERLKGSVTAWAVERQPDCVSGWQARWLRERFTGNVTAWAVERQRVWVSGWKVARSEVKLFVRRTSYVFFQLYELIAYKL